MTPLAGSPPLPLKKESIGGDAGPSGQPTVRSNVPVDHQDHGNLFDVHVHDVFDSKKELQKQFHLMMMMITEYHFNVHKSSPSLVIVHCMDSNCCWRVRGMRVMNTECRMITKFVWDHTCAVLQEE